MKRLLLAMRLLRRDWRAGELTVLTVALVIAIGAISAIGLFSDRMERAVSGQTAELVGADLRLSGPQPVPRAWLDRARTDGLRLVETMRFPSVVVHGDSLQLATVEAVDEGYPLRGTLRTSDRAYGTEAIATTPPAAGTTWLEPRLLQALGVNPGDTIEIGNAPLRVEKILTYQPGRGGSFFTLAPRALIAVADVPRTGVVQPGSRVVYEYQFTGSDDALARYRNWLTPQLQANHSLQGIQDSDSGAGRVLQRANRYLGLTSLLAVVLAGVAVAMAAQRYTKRHLDMAALLRCFGVSQNGVLGILLPQFLVLGLIAAIAGVATGWLAQAAIARVLSDLLPAALPSPGQGPLWFALGTGLLMLAGFALPPLLRLKSVAPLRVLRRDLAPLSPPALLVYGAATAAVALLAWRYTQSWLLTASVLAGGALATVVLGAIALALLALARRLRSGVGAAWRFGFNNLWRRGRGSLGQMLAFGLALMAMAVIALLRNDLLSTWQTQLPPDTPNHFAFNILPADADRLGRLFADNNIDATAIYPMVRGRLTHINGSEVQRAVSKEDSNDGALHRELNLSWSKDLPPDNRITAGRWWKENELASGVSVESKLAQRLGIKLGDNLSFSVGGQPLQSTVTSLREVQWDSFHPNFYMIFAPGTLDNYPATWLTSFFLAPERKPLLGTIVKDFPSITVLEVDQVLGQLRRILQQVGAAVELVLLFVLAAGFTVLFAALANTLDQRIHEGALLRSLGASRGQLRSAQLAEFALLGLLAGLIAAAGSECIAWLLYTRAFDLDYRFKWELWLIAPAAGALLIGLAGVIGTRRVLRQSPMTVLREN